MGVTRARVNHASVRGECNVGRRAGGPLPVEVILISNETRLMYLWIGRSGTILFNVSCCGVLLLSSQGLAHCSSLIIAVCHSQVR